MQHQTADRQTDVSGLPVTKVEKRQLKSKISTVKEQNRAKNRVNIGQVETNVTPNMTV